jgi:type I restriction enzyme S subunit
MLGMIGEGKTRGQAAILDIYAAHNQNTSAIEKCVEEQSTEFLYFYLMQQYELTRKRGSGNNQKALNKTRVQAIEFKLAPIAEQKIISELLSDKLTAIERIEGAIEIQLRKAEKNKQSILTSAFSGNLNQG